MNHRPHISAVDAGTWTGADISPIEDIIDDMRAGRMVILIDEEDRENEGDLVLGAQFVTPAHINFSGNARTRPDLPDAERAPPSAQSGVDGRAHAVTRYSLHRFDRSRQRRDHRHFGADRAHTYEPRSPMAPGARPGQSGHVFR